MNALTLGITADQAEQSDGTLIVLDARKDYRRSQAEEDADWDDMIARLTTGITNPHQIASTTHAIRQMQRAIGPCFVRKS